MLETQLAELTAQIAALVEVLKANAQPQQPRQAEAPIPAAPEPELEVEVEVEAPIPAKPKPKPKAEPDGEISIAMLQDVCMAITRPDPDRKPEVVAVISSFGGALKVQDVPVADRKALFERLKLL